MQDGNVGQSPQSRLLGVARQPRITLFILGAWSLLAGVTQLFVNSGVFLDIHDMELDGAMGGFALSLNAIPLAVLYFYCARNPARYYHVFWLAIIHQAAMAFGSLYHLIIGTFSAESILLPLVGSLALVVLAFAQVFTPREQQGQPPP